MKESSLKFTGFCLMLAIIIDIMGIGLVFPLLPSLFVGSHAPFLNSGTYSMQFRELCYGLSIALWAGGLFIGTPFLGDLSDQVGRKKVLVVCLVMMGVSYILSALSLWMSNLSFFMLSRLMSGFFGASYSLAQAAFVDMSTPENKAKNISYVTLAASVGIVFGPLLSAISLKLAIGVLAVKLPFILAAILSFVNAIAIYILLQETFVSKQGARADLLSAVRACGFMFLDRRVRFLSLIFLLLQFSWGLYVQALPMILAQQYALSSIDISLFYVLMGLSFGFGVLVVQPYFLKRMSLKAFYLIGAFVMSCLFLSAGIYLHVWWQIVVVLIVCVFELFAYTGLIALISNAVSDQEQGKALGGSGAIFGIAWTLTAFSLGRLLVFDVNFPFYVSAFFGFLTVNLMLWFKENAR